MTDYKIPEWCKDAVLTDRGVASMITGELYISKKGVGDLPYRVLIREITLIKGSGKTGQIPKCCKTPYKKSTPKVKEVVEVEPVKEVEPELVKPTVKKSTVKRSRKK